jgi:hypothetical protein
LDERLVPAAPTISSLNGEIIGSTMIVYGTVQDDQPGTDTVTASGGLSGTYRTGVNGLFEFIGSYTGNGNVTITVHNDAGLTSNPSGIMLAPQPGNMPPYVSMGAIWGTAVKSVVVSGTVYDESPGGLTVTIAGVASGSTTTDSAGHFSVTVTAGSLGDLTAHTTDSGGLGSNLASVTLTMNPPVISDLSITSTGYHLFELRGKVTGLWVAGLTVRLSSAIPEFNGQTATVGSDGWFTVDVTTDYALSAYVCVDFTDVWGQNAAQQKVLFAGA